jgi:vancomycin permeability regulator SanA
LILWFAIHITITVIDGLNDELEYVDAAVVLGNKVEENGEPSKRLKSRLDKAVELHEKKYFEYIIVSGGLGKEGFDEAIIMKKYLMNRGINEENIIVDSKGNNTMMTAKNSKEIMSKKGFDSVMVITQFYHITRSKLAFKRVGFKKVYSSHANFFELRDIYSLIREFFGYYKYRFVRI